VRLRPEAPSIYLPDSGQIDLNAIGVEAGQANNSQTALNDAAVRDMIGKASGAQNAMNEYYGASSSDAVDVENFGNGYLIGLHGYVNQGTSGSLDQDIIDEGENLRTGADTYAHRWPLSFDGQPHAFTSEYPSIAKNWSNDKNDPSFFSNQLPIWQPKKVGLNNNVKQRRRNVITGRMELSLQAYGAHEGYNVTPLQRLKKGRYTISGNLGDDTESGPAQWWSTVTGSILQFETMTPVSATMAQAGGATIKTQLAEIKGAPGNTGNNPFSVTVDIQHEWVFLQIFAETPGNNYGYVYLTVYVTSINKV